MWQTKKECHLRKIEKWTPVRAMKIKKARIIFRTKKREHIWISQGFTLSETLTINDNNDNNYNNVNILYINP